MTDEERAELLARAIDELIRGVETPDTDHGLQDDELDALLEIAEVRLEEGRASQRDAAGYETEVWYRLKERLAEERQTSRPDIDLPRDQHDALADIIALRMRMAREVFDIAESHRDEVWARVQSRMGSLGAAAPTPHDVPIHGASDDDVEAITRRSLARLAEIASDPVHNRFRERLKRDVRAFMHHPEMAPQAPRLDTRVILGAAVIVALVAALAPLPLTGVDGHPAVQLAQTLAGNGAAEGAPTVKP